MAIKSDTWIREQALQRGMIAPFSEKQVREGVISYGLSSYGYDLASRTSSRSLPT
jgi:dCTP deaminase